MDKLEHYLDRVCRSIGGPRSLRQHVRRELREHLLDAAAGHRAAGLSEEEALERAVADFGRPEEVRAGLEEEYGHRLLPVVIDKALQWKERTMRARWLWASWAHLALATAIALEIGWLVFADFFLIPKFRMLMWVGIIDPELLGRTGGMWMAGFLTGLDHFAHHHLPWLAVAAVAAGGLFEWRVHGENKSLIRLSAWGTLAAALLVPAVLTAVSLVIPYMLAAPAQTRTARPFAKQQIAAIDTSLAAAEQALADEDWESVDRHVGRASEALHALAAEAPAVWFLTLRTPSPSVEEQRAQLRSADGFLAEARRAAGRQDSAGVRYALAKFRETYEPAARAVESEAARVQSAGH